MASLGIEDHFAFRKDVETALFVPDELVVIAYVVSLSLSVFLCEPGEYGVSVVALLDYENEGFGVAWGS